MTRREHLGWAKHRALAYLNKKGDWSEAIASMLSDLNKHPELETHAGKLIFFMCKDVESTRKWIEGFN